jgi:hypothetical protein
VPIEKMLLLVVLLSLIVVASKLWLQTGWQRMTKTIAPPVWSELDVSNLRRSFRDGMPVSDIADYLLRTEEDVRLKARDLGIVLSAN